MISDDLFPRLVGIDVCPILDSTDLFPLLEPRSFLAMYQNASMFPLRVFNVNLRHFESGQLEVERRAWRTVVVVVVVVDVVLEQVELWEDGETDFGKNENRNVKKLRQFERRKVHRRHLETDPGSEARTLFTQGRGSGGSECHLDQSIWNSSQAWRTTSW